MIETRHIGLCDGIAAHLAGLLSHQAPDTFTPRPISQTCCPHLCAFLPSCCTQCPECLPSLFFRVSLLQTLQTSALKVFWKPFLNTTSRSMSTFSYVLYALCLYLLQSNDDSMLYICMALDLVWEAMAVASFQGLCLVPCQEHRRHWHISAECINPRLFSSLLMENPLASNCLLGTKITSA